MLPYSTKLSRVAIGLFFVLAIGYGVFEAKGIILGPQISIADTPTVVATQFVRIQGSATHIASLSMNGAAIPVTETGGFDEPFLLAKGENRILFEAKDKYGNTTKKTVILVYEPAAHAAATTSPETATTTDGGI